MQVEESSDPQSGKDRLMKQLALLKNLKVWKSINVTEMTRKDIENLDSKMKKGYDIMAFTLKASLTSFTDKSRLFPSIFSCFFAMSFSRIEFGLRLRS